MHAAWQPRVILELIGQNLGIGHLFPITGEPGLLAHLPQNPISRDYDLSGNLGAVGQFYAFELVPVLEEIFHFQVIVK